MFFYVIQNSCLPVFCLLQIIFQTTSPHTVQGSGVSLLWHIHLVSTIDPLLIFSLCFLVYFSAKKNLRSGSTRVFQLFFNRSKRVQLLSDNTHNVFIPNICQHKDSIHCQPSGLQLLSEDIPAAQTCFHNTHSTYQYLSFFV